ncbi:MAG: thiamine phosphate synthase [Anaerolineae bacterium]
MRSFDPRLYVILDTAQLRGRSCAELAEAIIEGGATVLQLRAKAATTREMIDLGRAVLQVTRRAGIPLIINDRVDVALAIGADGVHVGPDDMPAPLARQLLGSERILGVSAGTVEEAKQAEADGATYLGVGDVYGTRSKPDAGVPIGIEGLRQIAQAVRIPVVGIGGITADNAAAVLEAGAHGIAVISAVMGAIDPLVATRNLRRIVEAAYRASLDR